jgi:pilus assembly protein CpaB
MRAKSLILLTVALGCGMVAAVAVSKTLMEKDSGTSEATVEILVAVQEIKSASKVSVEKIKLEKWPKSKMPEGAYVNVKDVEGKYATQNMYPGEPLISHKLSDSNNSMGTTIPAGFTIFDVPYQNNYIKAGDWVDISGTFLPGGRNKSPEVRTVLKGVQVFAINGNPDRNVENKGGKDTVFNLLIKQTQHQALLLAHKMGSLDLNIRPLDENGNIKGLQEDTGEKFLEWAKEQSLPTLNEPVVEKLVTTQPVISQPSFEKPAPKKKSEILILTPGGVKRYEYSGKELPTEVSQNTQDTKLPANPSNPWQTSSGYGGYSPTYPNTSPTAPGTSALEAGAIGPPPGSVPANGTKPNGASPIN